MEEPHSLDNCSQIKDYFTKMAVLMASPDSEWYKWRRKCIDYESSVFTAMLNTPRIFKKQSQLRLFLSKRGIKGRQLENIIHIYRIKKKKILKKDASFLLSRIMSSINKESIRKESMALLDEIKEFPEGLMKKFLSTLLALHGGNEYWAGQLIREILMTPYEAVVFEKPVISRHTDYKKFKKVFFDALVYMEKSLSDKRPARLLASYMNEFFKEEEFLPVKKKINANWSLIEMRERYRSYLYGKRFPFLWYSILNRRAYGTEGERFLEENLSKRSIQRHGGDGLWIYTRWMPSNEKLRKVVFDEIEKIITSKRDIDRYFLLNLMDNEVIGKQLVQKHKELQRPLFSLKREYYRSLLKKNHLIHFSLYELAKLGDRREELLWWIVL